MPTASSWPTAPCSRRRCKQATRSWRSDVGEHISGLKALLEVHDLRSIDPDKLLKASEGLVVALQAAGPKLGLATPTLEGTAK